MLRLTKRNHCDSCFFSFIVSVGSVRYLEVQHPVKAEWYDQNYYVQIENQQD